MADLSVLQLVGLLGVEVLRLQFVQSPSSPATNKSQCLSWDKGGEYLRDILIKSGKWGLCSVLQERLVSQFGKTSFVSCQSLKLKVYFSKVHICLHKHCQVIRDVGSHLSLCQSVHIPLLPRVVFTYLYWAKKKILHCLLAAWIFMISCSLPEQ